jgi:hypothetical protein
MHTDRCGNTHRWKCRAKGSGKEVKIQEYMYRCTTNVGPEMYDYTGNNWSHWNSNENLKEKFGRFDYYYYYYYYHHHYHPCYHIYPGYLQFVPHVMLFRP